MEYLMTYGWAILIIAVVLGVLFQLGVFSGSALAPKAQPGSCQVQRLLGQVSLEGLCQGQLPQFVMNFPNTTSIAAEVPMSASMNTVWGSQGSWTITGWFRETYPVNALTAESLLQESAGCTAGLWIDNASTGSKYSLLLEPWFQSGSSGACSSPIFNPQVQTAAVPLNSWVFVAGGVNWAGVSGTGNYIFACVNNKCSTAIIAETVPPENYAQYGYIFQLGADSCCTSGGQPVLGGQLANVQLYNVSLSLSEVNALYLEGIGGAPVRIQNLVGWWPLNGDFKDYSGNNNNGALNSKATFNSTWNSQYTPP